MHDFPSEIFLHLNTTTSIGEAVKTFETEFWKFYHNGSFFQKNVKIAKKNIPPGFATSGRHNSAMIADRRKFTAKLGMHGIRKCPTKIYRLKNSVIPVYSDISWRHQL